jgi:hypothetical protein
VEERTALEAARRLVSVWFFFWEGSGGLVVFCFKNQN